MLSVEGSITSGLNKAKYFMQKENYVEQYGNTLGFMPYPGTLNIKLKDNISLDIHNSLKSKLKKIEGNGTLGDVLFLNATIYTLDKHASKEGAILFPEKTVYKTNLLEFVSDEKIRDFMDLKDDDNVIVTINDE